MAELAKAKCGREEKTHRPTKNALQLEFVLAIQSKLSAAVDHRTSRNQVPYPHLLVDGLSGARERWNCSRLRAGFEQSAENVLGETKALRTYRAPQGVGL